jgi:hypothetical protein
VFAAQSPWIMKTPDEMRPVAPPDLKSEAWARDLNEVKRLGARKSKDRTAERTDVAQFWAGRSVRIVLNQLVGRPGRSLGDDARFLALAEMAWADSYVAMMDGKYHYQFWRPVTAIRRRQRRHRGRHAVGARHRNAAAPRVPLRPLRFGRRGGHRDRQRVR